MTPAGVLREVVAAVEAEGERLRAEFYAPTGPRGRRGNCPADREIEERLQVALQALVPAQFCGEECAITPGTRQGWVWLVDPHDGTFEFKIPKRPIRKKITGLPAFTTVRGGAYFFLPGLKALRYLVALSAG